MRRSYHRIRGAPPTGTIACCARRVRTSWMRMARVITHAEAQRISRRMLRKLGAAQRGTFVAVEMRTGQPYVGATSLAAIQAGLEEHPRGRFYIERLGHDVAGIMRRWRER